ncbi:hypothetical protein [Serratia oryzae]|uniref:hypothetical protein n=1 Tax=Serratia oryzae TaxID=2034155 RepID=UPI00097676D0|nr:hypothetical protein [Serratia oryzae]
MQVLFTPACKTGKPGSNALIRSHPRRWPWRLLSLNLNYHLIHHDLPHLRWYGLCQVYLAEQRAYRQRSHGVMVAGYGAWLAGYVVTLIAVEVHPFAAADLTSDTQNDWPTLALTRWVGAAQHFPTDPAP